MKKGYGWKLQKLDHRDYKLDPPPIDITKPVDLRPKMPSVYDQGQVGSCVANATAAAFEHVRRSQSLPDWIPSRLFIYYATRALEGVMPMQDTGSQCRDAVKVVTTIGAPPESAWAYNTNEVNIRPSQSAYDAAKHNLALQYDAVPQKLNHLVSCLTHNGPIIWGCSVFEQFESEEAARTGTIEMPSPTDAPIGGHSTLLVGWKPETQQFIFRNSWGLWGDLGYGYIPADYVLNPNLSSDFWVLWLTSKGN